MVENKADEIPLEELSINDLFIGGDARTYEIPIYQRNYAWEEEQVKALITDVTDAYTKNPDSYYYIGTLVSYNKGDQIFEIIDGQQRLTTIRLILGVLISEGHLKGEITNKLTYRARKKSDYTLKGIPSKSDINTEKQKSSDSREPCRSSIFQKYDDKKLIDFGILNGFKFAENNIRNLDILENDFVNYFLHKVHIIHYKVPRDIDLNHYFEVMNSRGEQLEKHEIVKAQLINKIGDIKDSDDLKKKNRILLTKIWEACSNMGKYVQQNLNKNDDCNFVFGDKFDTFNYKSFQEIADKFYNNFDRKIEELKKNNKTESSSAGCAEISLDKIIELKPSIDEFDKEGENTDSFQPIIDFPNFLLIVLKITLMQIRLPENNFDYCGFPLDDKELLSAFKDQIIDSSDVVKKFIFNLLKARFLLDNYVVHHVFEEDTEESNPWKIQIYTKEESSSDNSNNKYSYSYKNSFCNSKHQEQLVQLLSMFEVTYSQKQRKNYLFYCLYYLMNSFDTARSYYDSEQDNDNTYAEFVEKLADKFFFDVYLGDNLIEKDKNDQSEEVYLHNPKAGAFNSVIKIDEFINNRFNCQKKHTDVDFFFKIYGDGIKRASEGIPLYIFNYLDYKLWKLYVTDVRGREANKKEFFETRLGCPDDISLDVFNRFYFSRTRKSLEHFYPQAGATGDNDSTNEIAIDDKGPLNQTQINCIGNFAMIGSEANSSGSNWTPKTKLDHYLDDSSKIKFISVASLKFMIMMHICKKSNKEDNYKWGYNEIQDHQKKMLALLGLTGNDNITGRLEMEEIEQYVELNKNEKIVKSSDDFIAAKRFGEDFYTAVKIRKLHDFFASLNASLHKKLDAVGADIVYDRNVILAEAEKMYLEDKSGYPSIVIKLPSDDFTGCRKAENYSFELAVEASYVISIGYSMDHHGNGIPGGKALMEYVNNHIYDSYKNKLASFQKGDYWFADRNYMIGKASPDFINCNSSYSKLYDHDVFKNTVDNISDELVHMYMHWINSKEH